MNTDITEEITCYLGQKLFEGFISHAAPRVEFSIDTRRYVFEEARGYSDWLTSPTGIDAVKLAMIKREFNYHIQSSRYITTQYECAFFDMFSRKSAKSLLEVTAVLLAAYYALSAKDGSIMEL